MTRSLFVTRRTRRVACSAAHPPHSALFLTSSRRAKQSISNRMNDLPRAGLPGAVTGQAHAPTSTLSGLSPRGYVMRHRYYTTQSSRSAFASVTVRHAIHSGRLQLDIATPLSGRSSGTTGTASDRAGLGSESRTRGNRTDAPQGNWSGTGTAGRSSSRARA